MFVLRVQDDGVGIPAAPGRYKHFGLSIMKERAEALHGTPHGGAGRGWRHLRHARRPRKTGLKAPACSGRIKECNFLQGTASK